MTRRPDHRQAESDRDRHARRTIHRLHDAGASARRVHPRTGRPGPGREDQTLPEAVRRSLTWDQGVEMRDWKQVAIRLLTSRSSSATRTSRGSAALTRTPTACCVSTFPRAATCPSTAQPTWTGSPPNSTTDPQTPSLRQADRTHRTTPVAITARIRRSGHGTMINARARAVCCCAAIRRIAKGASKIPARRPIRSNSVFTGRVGGWAGVAAGGARRSRGMTQAYLHEVSSCGYWPDGGPEGVFYSYAYPTPPGFAATLVRPAEARWSEDHGEFLLPYETIRLAADPEAILLEFLQSTYEAAANAAGWDREKLERQSSRAGQGLPRARRGPREAPLSQRAKIMRETEERVIQPTVDPGNSAVSLVTSPRRR